MSKIHPRHVEFVRQYFLKERNATAAYKVVYPNCKTPVVNASRLLTNANVMAEIKKRESELEAKFQMTHDDVIKGLMDIIRFNPFSVLKWHKGSLVFRDDVDPNLISGANFSIYPEYQNKADKADKVTRAKVSYYSGDKKGAWELIGKYLGTWSKDGEKEAGSGAGEGSGEDGTKRLLRIINERQKRRRQAEPTGSQDGD